MTRLQLYRRESSLPESISGMAVNEKHIVTVRNSGVVELFSNPYMFKISCFDIGMRDIQSAEFDGKTIVINSLSEGIAYIDTVSFSIKKHRSEGAWKVYAKNGSRMVIYSLVEGGSELHVNELVVYRSAEYITSACFVQEKDSYLVGTQAGRVLLIKQRKALFNIVLSSSTSAPITDIACVVGAEYAVSTMEGMLYIIDIADKEIKQKIAVRNSSINGLCTIGDRIFMIGADSRVVCYSKTAQHYTKESQHDFHVSDGLFIKECCGNIVTVSDDGSINICNIPKVGKPACIKRYQDMPCTYANKKMYAASGNEMRIYDVAESTERPKLIFKHITKNPILAMDSLNDTSVIRTKEGIRAYYYDWKNSTVLVKKQIKGFILYHTIIDGRIWYVVGRNRLFLAVASVKSDDGDAAQEWMLDKIGVDYIPSHIAKGGKGSVLISGSDVVVFDFENSKSYKVSDKDFQYLLAVATDNKIYCAGQYSTLEIRDRSIISIYSADRVKIDDVNLSFRMPVTDMQEYNGNVFSVLQHQLKIIKLDGLKKKAIIGPIIDKVKVSMEGVVAMHRLWAFTKQKLPLQVLKEKYGRK